VSLSRKLCLFMCYVKQVGNKQWVARGTISIYWKREIRRYKMNIRRGVQGQRRTGLLFLVEAIVDCV
jgi:hypothetical protein